jgi:hypothetical protein
MAALRKFSQDYCKCSPCDEISVNILLIAPKIYGNSVRDSLQSSLTACEKMKLNVTVVYSSNDRFGFGGTDGNGKSWVPGAPFGGGHFDGGNLFDKPSAPRDPSLSGKGHRDPRLTPAQNAAADAAYAKSLKEAESNWQSVNSRLDGYQEDVKIGSHDVDELVGAGSGDIQSRIKNFSQACK